MGVGAQAGDSLPGGGHDEVLYESARTRVIRSRPAGRASCFVQKQPRGQGEDRRLRHERALLERLADVPGVVRLAAGASSPDLIALEDAGATTLADAVADGPISVPDLLEVACEVAMILAGVHHAGVIHRDLSPTNILWDRDSRRLTLVDFDLATVGGEELPAFAHPYAIAGTLAYLAPEQTGRTGWPVDQRADLYGFGAVLYELATGQPPFGFGGPLELVHDHLARVPEPPVSRNPGLPAAFSQVVLRLLERSRTAVPERSGLVHDRWRSRPWER
jgi:serine/threonine protein kinase